jgi:integrase
VVVDELHDLCRAFTEVCGSTNRHGNACSFLQRAAHELHPPNVSRPESITWTADQLRTYLERTRGSRFWAAYLLLATTGLRRGEALGLRWQDLDLDGGRAFIRQSVIAIKHTVMIGTPKTAKGRRTVTLDKGTVAALREHRARQAAERLLMGGGWTDNDFVFCHPEGTMLHPERFSRGFTEWCARSDYRGSGCTISDMVGQPWRCRLAFIRRWLWSG